jgi:acyl-CoA dehydrogenase
MSAASPIFTAEHELFRDQVRKFVAREIAPHHAQWEKDKRVPKEVWRKAGEAGLLCMTMPEEYGGGGADVLHAIILGEELARVAATGPGFGLHSDIIAPYINNVGSEEQKKKWLPKMASGEVIAAIAMTEPGAGSDLQNIKTTAKRDGNQFVINGSKTFISNGQNADLIVVVAKTDPKEGAKGTTLFLVESDREGFRRGRNLEKVGRKAQDTSELFFDNVRVPPENMLGGEGQGFMALMRELPRERMLIATNALAGIDAALATTLDYVKQRKAFGKAIIEFQNSKFKLAEMKTEALVARTFVEHCLRLLMENKLDVTTAAMAKLYCTDLQGRVVDECLQLHGGYGYMWEYPIARLWADARVQRIFGGANEIMKELIGRSL